MLTSFWFFSFVLFCFLREPYWLISPSSIFGENWALPNRTTSFKPQSQNKKAYVLPLNTLPFQFIVGPAPHRERDYCIGSNFWKFYLIKTGFTFGEPISLVKVFRLFRLEWILFGVQSVDSVGRCTTSYLLAEVTQWWCLVIYTKVELWVHHMV